MNTFTSSQLLNDHLPFYNSSLSDGGRTSVTNSLDTMKLSSSSLGQFNSPIINTISPPDPTFHELPKDN